MDILRSSRGEIFWADIRLSDDAICDLRKALVEAVSDGIGEGEDYHVEDEGEDGYRCDMSQPEPRPAISEMLYTYLDNAGVVAFLLATRKLHLNDDYRLNDNEVDDVSEKHDFATSKNDIVFSAIEPAS